MGDPQDGDLCCMLPSEGGTQKFWHKLVNGVWVNTGEKCQPPALGKKKGKAGKKTAAGKPGKKKGKKPGK